MVSKSDRIFLDSACRHSRAAAWRPAFDPFKAFGSGWRSTKNGTSKVLAKFFTKNSSSDASGLKPWLKWSTWSLQGYLRTTWWTKRRRATESWPPLTEMITGTAEFPGTPHDVVSILLTCLSRAVEWRFEGFEGFEGRFCAKQRHIRHMDSLEKSPRLPRAPRATSVESLRRQAGMAWRAEIRSTLGWRVLQALQRLRTEKYLRFRHTVKVWIVWRRRRWRICFKKTGKESDLWVNFKQLSKRTIEMVWDTTKGFRKMGRMWF